MAWIDPRFEEHQRKRFMRENWRLYVRQDVERYFLPGCCLEELKPVYPKSAAQRRREEEEARAAEEELEAIAREERQQLAQAIEQERLKIKSEMAWLRFKRAWLLHRTEQQKAYDPNQPRVPAGNPGGGRWTSGNPHDEDAPQIEQTTDISAAARTRGHHYVPRQIFDKEPLLLSRKRCLKKALAARLQTPVATVMIRRIVFTMRQ